MARPAKTLLQRCQERSFRARHHWSLLVREPDLPCPSLGELQQRARAAESEDAVRAIARLFGRRLDSLPAEERRVLLPQQSAAAVTDKPSERKPPAPASARRERNAAFLTVVEAFLAELPLRFRTELSSAEAIQAELLRRAAERLSEIDQRLAEETLTVSGSKGQLRPHPLLASEASLRRELIHGLQQLEFRLRNRAQVEQINALTRAPRTPKRAPKPKQAEPWSS